MEPQWDGGTKVCSRDLGHIFYSKGLYTCGKNILKNVYKIRIQRDLFETCNKATNGRSDKGFLLTSNVCPCPGLYTCIKSLKMCIKSDFEEIILKLATYRQREKAFLLS